MRAFLLLTSLFVFTGCVADKSPSEPETLSLSQGWVLEGFDSPESIISDGSGNYFVSNVNGEATKRDGNGYISLISGEGAIIEKNWSGEGTLNAPKGMTLKDGTLYVSDIDALVLINAKSGNIIDRITVEGAAFFNDVAASEQGVFVTDSGLARIHKLENGNLPVWLEADSLAGINGLLPQEDRLLVTTMSKGEVLSVDWSSKSITPLVSAMENADGLGQRKDGSFIVSSWPGQIWHGHVNEEPIELLDSRGENPIYQNDILVEVDRILAPNWQPGTVREYRILTQPAK